MPIESRIKVAVAQTDCQLGNLKHNLAFHLDIIEQARAQGVSLLVFPELSLTGYRLGNKTPEIALSRDDAIITTIADAAHGLNVLFGLAEQAPADQLYHAIDAVRAGRLLL